MVLNGLLSCRKSVRHRGLERNFTGFIEIFAYTARAGADYNSYMDKMPNIWEHCLEHAALSDVGLRRSNNQDSLAVSLAASQQAWEEKGHLFTVADGMGAHAAGELASKIAAEIIPLTYHKLAENGPPEALRKAVIAANAHIHDRGQASRDFRGMGTTGSTLALLPQGALVGHVGDSRVYRLRGWQFEQLTFDHSLVWEMSNAQKISEREVPDYVPKNIITRSLGPNKEVQVDIEGYFPLEIGDTFLLCSDGLTGPVNDEEIGTILGCLHMNEAVRALVDLANVRGGPDNITVLVVKITAPQKADQTAAAAVNTPPSRPRPVHPLLWSLLGVFGLGALGAAAMGEWVAALWGLAASLGALGVVLASRYAKPDTTSQHDGQPLGKGPYTSFNCTPSRHFVERLGKTVSQLREAAAQEKWTVKWHRFDELIVEAAKAAEEPDFKAAVRSYCLALSFIMDQLRHQSRGGGPAPR